MIGSERLRRVRDERGISQIDTVGASIPASRIDPEEAHLADTRRLHRRHKLKRVYASFGSDKVAIITDCSETGIGFEIFGSVNEGQTVALEFALPGSVELRMQGHIVWASDGRGGLQFLNVTRQEQKQIQSALLDPSGSLYHPRANLSFERPATFATPVATTQNVIPQAQRTVAGTREVQKFDTHRQTKRKGAVGVIWSLAVMCLVGLVALGPVKRMFFSRFGPVVTDVNPTVFNVMTIGDLFEVPECPISVTASAGVQYAPAATPCFQRTGGAVLRRPIVTAGKVSVIFPDNEIPEMVPGGTVFVVVRDRHTESINFLTGGDRTQELVLGALVEKYGQPLSLRRVGKQNEFGRYVRSNEASWQFPEFNVSFEGVTNGTDKGEVTIEYKPPRQTTEKLRGPKL